jgi:hypothetical protein
MPPADADDSLGKNSRYYKVGRLPFVWAEPSPWPIGAPRVDAGAAEAGRKARANE